MKNPVDEHSHAKLVVPTRVNPVAQVEHKTAAVPRSQVKHPLLQGF
jgi:hypothetical protein